MSLRPPEGVDARQPLSREELCGQAGPRGPEALGVWRIIELLGASSPPWGLLVGTVGANRRGLLLSQ